LKAALRAGASFARQRYHRSNIYPSTKLEDTLIAIESDPRKVDDASALMYAVSQPIVSDSRRKLITYMLRSKYVDVNARSRGLGETALHAAARCGNCQAVQWLLRAGASVELLSYIGVSVLGAAVSGLQVKAASYLLEAPGVYSTVVLAESEAQRVAGVFRKQKLACMFARWHLVQAVCAAACVPAVPGASPPSLLPLLAALAAEKAARKKPENSDRLIAHARAANNLTALAGAVTQGGAQLAVVSALIAAGCSALPPVDAHGTSLGAFALRLGQQKSADKLYRAASKSAAREQPLFRQVRSELVVANRVGLPRDVVDHMLEWCAAPKCWFVKKAPPAPGPAIGAGDEQAGACMDEAEAGRASAPAAAAASAPPAVGAAVGGM
jgi:hypothetical protein